MVNMRYGGSHHSHSSANWVSTGSRNKDHSGNLVIGGQINLLTGSLTTENFFIV